MSSRRHPDVRSTYLRDLGDNVGRGLELVAHDLVATHAMDRPRAEVAVRILAEEHLEFVRGSGLPVTAHEVAVRVGQAVQEDLIEGTGNEPPLVTWPRCPDHSNHPLWLRRSSERQDGGAVDRDETWTCITTHRSVAELGQL